ncbi:porin [Candidatus Pelagibacter ubique]|nr:porin [Candidatus Pelagibacter ubique]
MNLKKIGLTALAGSLVATSVYAGELAVSGSASMKVVHVNGGAANTGKAWSMGNSVTFSGGGELDNGMTVAVSFELDQGAANNTAVTSTGTVAANSGAVFDSHSVTVSSDALGSLTFAGHGGSSAQSAIDTTAAGDLWDSTFGITAAQDPKASATSNNMISYTLPSIVDGVALAASYTPTSSTVKASSTAYSIAYTGVEGLAVHYASGEDNGTTGSTADVDTIKATYAYGPISVGYSSTEYDNENTGADFDQDVESYSISYTVSENISISYGSETISEPNDTDDQDIEISGITASYTTGGMTISGQMIDADNTAMTTATTEDKQHWNLAASFAF